MLEPEDEREEVDELWPPSRLLRPWALPWRRLEPPPAPDARPPPPSPLPTSAAVVVVATPALTTVSSSLTAAIPGATTSAVAIPAVAAVAAPLFVSVPFLQRFLRGRPKYGVESLVVGHAQNLHQGKGRGAFHLPGEGVIVRRAQAAHTERSFARNDDSLSDVGKAAAVFPTAFASSAKNPTLNVDAITSTLPFIKASSPARDF